MYITYDKQDAPMTLPSVRIIVHTRQVGDSVKNS